MRAPWHSDNLKLVLKASHLSLLDSYAGDGAALAEYRSVYAAWRQVSGQLADLRQDEGQRLRTREMLEYQIADIDAAHLKPGEEDKLTARRDRLQHQEKIDRQLRLAARALRDGEKATAAGLLDRAATALASLTGILPEAEELAARAESLRLEAEDIADRTRALTDGDAVDATAELDRLEGRLDTIQRLGRKYGAGVDAILAFRADAAERLAGLDTADDRIAACEEQEKRLRELTDDFVAVTAKGRPIHPKTLGQKEYLAAIRKNAITFGVGPAGTGKTYLAVAMAVKAFKSKDVSRIILTRPAVEAGEKLGFLPGDLQNKVDPYLRPLYDGLFDLLGAETFQKLFEKQVIEVAPLAYMRGRTLDDAFIILDEAQNTTPEQMKMFLTRMGVGSKVVVTGDVTQIDLPDKVRSGLIDALHVLRDVEGIAQVRLTEKDVVRHRLVQQIVKAYEKAAEEKAPGSHNHKQTMEVD